jgi:DnaJ-domain-containing protein 1
MRLAKDGKLETKEDFEKAMNAIGTGKKKDNILEAKIRDSAKVKNAQAVIEYDISKAMAAIKTNDYSKILKEAEQNALMKKELELLELEEERRKAMPRPDGVPYTPMSDMEKADYLVSIVDNFRGRAYKSKIDEMGIKDIQNQNPAFFNVKEAVAAIKQRLEASPTFQDEFNKAVIRNTSTSKQALLRQKGLLGYGALNQQESNFGEADNGLEEQANEIKTENQTNN